ncbi:dynamin [Actinoplanes italicus]|uniref:Dynamin family protein n=1 Tax=Actinoplanes italicus TaxID=113567 RepID=A0A2T0K8M9_9ACTN|nr:dynamin family protein [Actinoplanes italicus]PRX19434.1 dynamin family protein [Actinoplanes italicus]GIE30551.1 dynamin [Actinoplanes italicus]
MSAGTEPPALVNQVLTLANEVHGLARRNGQADLAVALAAEAERWREATATVVVAGAQKRGKSRLINALLDRPGLVPVDVDIATHTYLALRHGPRLTATVRRRGPDGQETSEQIDPDEVGDYASLLGDPARRRGVEGVDITLQHPLLDGVRLVDTPGVDSLTLGHRHTTTAMLRQADALLFTLSAQDQPVLRHELEFLAEAAGGIHAIAFVLTKVEDSTSWQDLLTENRRRLDMFLKENADRFEDTGGTRRLLDATWIPVSAKLAEAAAARRAAGLESRAEQLWERSGMDRLTAWIRACGEGRELARCGRVLSAAGVALRSLAVAEEDRRVAATRDADEVAQRLAGVETALRDLSARARERHRLAVEHQFLGREIGALVRRRLDEVRNPYEDAITALTSAAKTDQFLAELPESVERSLEAAWSTITAEVQDRATTVLTEFLTAMDLDPIEVDLAALRMPAGTRPRLETARPAKGGFDMLREGVPGLAIAASLTTLMIPLGPFAFVVGPAVALGVTHRRHQWEQASRTQNGVRRAITETFSGAASELTTALERAVARWRSEAEQAVDEALGRQRREHEQRRAELLGLTTRDTAARRDAAATAERRLAAITELAGRTAALHRAVAGEIARNAPVG